MPTKKLCQALANNSANTALVRELWAKIQLDPKKRKKLEQPKNYHLFGLACIQSENPTAQLNPLKANWHYRCVLRADQFNQQIGSLFTSGTVDLDLAQARLIAKQSKREFSECTIPRLKDEVRAAEEILRKELFQPQHLQSACVATQSEQVAASPPPDSSSLLTVDDVAKQLKCDRRKVSALARNGELPFIDTNASKGKKNKCYRFHPDAVDRYLQGQSNTPLKPKPRRQRKKTTSDEDIQYYET